ncbi:hypothetical protein [Cerasicoccus arenae]|uniref:Uncharacterized protein n=1 Tax=Cerasicoccus arenae TaxID=424488 RepID=A0A8J3GD76_9BACT|nr:hypothetical protein [Cerasicoccus arenae]MBK1859741.1 hypothetical protein [Cerasicoccus arenae]GHB93535.1 hypothetical protein GCM10007047_06270 [Cerasicoccus arenae]
MNSGPKHIYRHEIRQSLWATLILVFVSLFILDGGYLNTVVVIACTAFWVGAILPILRKSRRRSDQIYLNYGLLLMLAVSFLAASIVTAKS